MATHRIYLTDLDTTADDPIAKAAWEYRFYSSKRVSSPVEVENRFKAKFREGVGRIVEGDGFAFAYRSCMQGQVGVPQVWWANKTANPDEIRLALKAVTG